MKMHIGRAGASTLAEEAEDGYVDMGFFFGVFFHIVRAKAGEENEKCARSDHFMLIQFVWFFFY